MKAAVDDANAIRTKVHRLFDDKFVRLNSDIPCKTKGLAFLINIVCHASLMVCMLMLVLEARESEKSLLLRRTYLNNIEEAFQFNDIYNIEGVRDLLATGVVNSWLGEANTTGAIEVINTNLLLGPVRVVKHQSSYVECTGEGLLPPLGGEPVLCEVEHAESFPPLKGHLSNVTFQYKVDVQTSCIITNCRDSISSTIPSSRMSYPFGGYSMDLVQGVYYVSGTPITNVTNEDLIADFVDEDTKVVRIEGVLFNPQYEIFGSFALIIECPVTGAYFPAIQLVFAKHLSSNFYLLMSVYLWVYTIVRICFLLGVVAKCVVQRPSCLTCNLGRDPNTAAVGKCWRCGGHVALDFVVTKCKECNALIPKLRHRCWRHRVLDFFSWVSLLNMVLLLASRAIAFRTQGEMEDLLGTLLSGGTESTSSPAAVFGPLSQLQTIEADMNALCIILAFIYCYRFLGKAAWCGRFLLVFTNGLGQLASFTLAFSILFVGFAIAFYVLLGSSNATFVTLVESMFTTFRGITGLLSWDELVVDERQWTFFLLYVFYISSCLLVLVNVLVSIVTTEYKKARETLFFDTETESLALLMAPVKARLKKLKKALTGKVKAPKDGDAAATATNLEETQSAESLLAMQKLEELQLALEDDSAVTVTKLAQEVENFTQQHQPLVESLEGRLQEILEQLTLVCDAMQKHAREQGVDPRALALPRAPSDASLGSKSAAKDRVPNTTPPPPPSPVPPSPPAADRRPTLAPADVEEL